MKKENILGIDVIVSDYEKLKENVKNDIKDNKKSFIVAINPEKVLKCRKDKRLRKLLNSATYQIPDGIGIIYASKLRGGKIKKRITGIDSMEMLCALASDRGYKIFMYGSKEETVKRAKEILEKRYKNLTIVGYINGYEKNNQKIIEEINKKNPDILFVALGSPKQELWISKNMSILNVKIFQGVGGSFDVLSGNIKRAPKWMQNIGLEWLYRLIQEPKRIFRQLSLIKFLLLAIFGKREVK